ncbi:MAG: hypothetical protein KatS3mg098_406 [Candidatus Parcubacteria bacterium]|nr:hypothetical protein [Patescibacteria group bacterium]BCX16177.1 MAG: hypothetical protein KatS3mg098_406 [Candidatus Parcubacteria bacterium]
MKKAYFLPILLSLVLIIAGSRELVFSQTTNNAPFVQTFSATNISTTSATLNGYVDPKGYQTTYYFEYSRSPSFDSITPLQLTSSAGNVSYTLNNLNPYTTYYFRLVAFNTYGTTYGNTLSFITQNNYSDSNYLTVSTNPAQNIGSYEAVLWGLASTSNENRVAWFEYGTSPNNLNQRTSAITIFPSSYYSSQNLIPTFWATVRGLNPATTYYYRAVLASGNNTVFGQILSFTTLGVSTNNPSYQEPQVKYVYLYPEDSYSNNLSYSVNPPYNNFPGYSVSIVPSHQYVYTGSGEASPNYYSNNNSLQASILQTVGTNNNLVTLGLILLFIILILLIFLAFKKRE